MVGGLLRATVAGAAWALAAASCADDPGAALEIVDARSARDPGTRRVSVDVDLRARESLGGNIGVYCVRTTFAGQAEPRETCAADLEDGDLKTLRFVSDGEVAAGAAIQVRARLGATDAERFLAAPL
jgi:hypothetical protein